MSSKLVCKLYVRAVECSRLKIFWNGLFSNKGMAVQLGGYLDVVGPPERLPRVADEHPICTPVVLHGLER